MTARANVATFPPLSGEQLAEISRLFAGTNVPQSVGGIAGADGGPLTVGGDPSRPPRRVPSAAVSGRRRVHPGAGRDTSSLPKS